MTPDRLAETAQEISPEKGEKVVLVDLTAEAEAIAEQVGQTLPELAMSNRRVLRGDIPPSTEDEF
jgi:hypothetical protein